jgi:hypothetical protein
MILEMLKKTFLKDTEQKDLSSMPAEDNIEQRLEDMVPVGFMDNETSNMYVSSETKKQKSIQLQTSLIKKYREIAAHPEVSGAIDEIVDEAVFSPGSDKLVGLDFKEDIPLEKREQIQTEFDDICRKMNINKNIYSMFRTYYVDGQLNIHCAYVDGKTALGIEKLSIISPFGLVYNYSKNIWEYKELGSTYSYGYSSDKDKYQKQFSKEEIIRIDSGIYNNSVIMSNLQTAIKPANMLRTLEDMLIPMRFTRSVARRIFNVDVSNLNNKKAQEVMDKHRREFKYKKFYDLENGTISNQQHVSALTEDYWFPNRGGEKGTTVDTLDETGNLGELDDVIYFKRKLYTALKVPTSRINDEGSSADFDYDSTSIDREEVKFFNFVSRLRNQFLDLFYELLKRQLIAKGVLTETEYLDLIKNMSIKFVSENKFFEKMNREHISESLNLYSEIEDLTGKYFSYEYVYKNVLKFSDADIEAMSKQIEKEKNDPVYKKFYEDDED